MNQNQERRVSRKGGSAASGFAGKPMTFSWFFGSSSHMLAQMYTAHLPYQGKRNIKINF